MKIHFFFVAFKVGVMLALSLCIFATAVLAAQGHAVTEAVGLPPPPPLLPLPRTFLNNGTVHSNDSFFFAGIPCLYLEPAIVTQAPYAWAAENTCQYLFQGQPGIGQCQAWPIAP